MQQRVKENPIPHAYFLYSISFNRKKKKQLTTRINTKQEFNLISVEPEHETSQIITFVVTVNFFTPVNQI